MTIKKEGDKYTLYNKKGDKKLGSYNSKAAATLREKQIQYFKAKDAGKIK